MIRRASEANHCSISAMHACFAGEVLFVPGRRPLEDGLLMVVIELGYQG